ncbi:MAG: RNB domain-containing ribonuclease, partial [Pseudomonadales bacterium]|nr:RNB domain-containing ribonuclease [Pseudomonadales bacterium]
MKPINAKALTQHLEALGGPAAWRDLVVAFDVTNSAERRDLRQLLAGMVRSGELGRDHAGAYHLIAAGSSQSGLIERAGKGLTFAGLPLERDRRTWLRPGDEVEARILDGEVHVLKVLNRSTALLVGVVRGRGRYAYVESLSADYRGRIDLVDAESAPAEGTTVRVEVLGEEQRSLRGRVIDTLGAGGGVEQAVETWLSSEGVPTLWPGGVDAQVAKLPHKVDAGRFPQRRSLMDLPLVTIDGATARDFDDAVYTEPRRGGWRLIVAIADVAHYVKPDSALDREALNRGNSVYFPDRVVPMLPEALSNGLCSLN